MNDEGSVKPNPPEPSMLQMFRWQRETLRMGLPFLLGIAILWNDSSWKVVLWGIGVVSIAAAMAHLFRRIFFPYLDFRKYAEASLQGNIAAGITLLAVSGVLCTLIYVFATFVRP